MSTFSALSEEVRAAIRTKQKARKQAKHERKLAKRLANAAQVSSAAGTPPAGGRGAGFPDCITSDEYFGAAPGGLFRHPQIQANEAGLGALLGALSRENDGEGLASCNYFQFAGTDAQPVMIPQSTLCVMLALRCTAVDWILITAYCFALP